MNSQSFPPVIRIYFRTRKGLQKLFSFLTACFRGIWLGILKRETLHLIDKIYSDNNEMYYDEEHNLRGLWKWEQDALNKHFQKCESILVAGVGGGREVLALRKSGYDVDGFECNPGLVEYANKLLDKEGLVPDIQLVPRDMCPVSSKIYDGLIIGWGTYMLIQGSEQRIAFLNKLRALTQEQCPILLSFFTRSGNERRFKVIAAIGKVIRLILRRGPVEVGDDLPSYYVKSGEKTKNYIPYYVHYFTREAIAYELSEGGFELDFYCTEEYAHAVGIASKE